MKNTHNVVFKNLIDVKTSKPATVEVPDALLYEDGQHTASEAGKRATHRDKARIRPVKKV